MLLGAGTARSVHQKNLVTYFSVFGFVCCVVANYCGGDGSSSSSDGRSIGSNIILSPLNDRLLCSEYNSNLTYFSSPLLTVTVLSPDL